jgi:PEP-CTERM motif
MCPVLSLANRAFLALLGTLLAFTSLPAQAEELQFSFTGDILTPDLQTIIAPFQVSFLVDTLAQGNSLQYTLIACPGGMCIDSFSANVAATNYNVTLGGQLIDHAGTGSFVLSGSPFSPPSPHEEFIGGFFGTSGGTAGFLGVPDFSLGNASQSVLLASTDPLGTVLDGSFYLSDSVSTFFNGDSRQFAYVSGSATSVPEPGTLGLLLLGLAGVVLCKLISVRAPALSA